MSDSPKSLHGRQSPLRSPVNQLDILNNFTDSIKTLPKFADMVSTCSWHGMPHRLRSLQMNLGKVCNQTCRHCHVDAGPDRKESMGNDVINACLGLMKNYPFKTLDITGGAPELHPHFRLLIEGAKNLTEEIIVRCNLSIILANKTFYDLPEFFAKHKVHVVASMPHTSAHIADRQRGQGVFEKSITAIRMLNKVGYGLKNSPLELSLMHNPVGAFLPGKQADLEQEYRRVLETEYSIHFTRLLALTNVPISRYLDYLLESNNLERYMQLLVQSFNPCVLDSLMCRNTLSVSWKGELFDCDFNQMLDLSIGQSIFDLNVEALSTRRIRVNQHCYACTAGSGSSCGGELKT